MFHVRELNGIDGTSWVVGVGESVSRALGEVLPLKVHGHALDGAEHVVVQSTSLLALAASKLDKGFNSLLEHLDNVGLEGLEVILDGDEIVVVVVLGKHLIAKPMHDTSQDDIRVVASVQLAAGRVVRCRLLAQKLNMLLGGVAHLVDLLSAALSSTLQLLGLVLDLLVQALKNGHDGPLEALLGLDVGVDHRLGVGAHVLEEAGDTAEALVEVMALLERIGDGLLSKDN